MTKGMLHVKQHDKHYKVQLIKTKKHYEKSYLSKAKLLLFTVHPLQSIPQNGHQFTQLPVLGKTEFLLRKTH